jgi:hypothetical protein
MINFVHPHNVIVRNAFSTFPNAQNGGELEGGAKSGRLKRQFSQMERDMNLQEIPKLIPIVKEKISRKRTIMMKDENEKGKKFRKHWVDGEVLHLIGLKGEMELEFSKSSSSNLLQGALINQLSFIIFLFFVVLVVGRPLPFKIS